MTTKRFIASQRCQSPKLRAHVACTTSRAACAAARGADYLQLPLPLTGRGRVPHPPRTSAALQRLLTGAPTPHTRHTTWTKPRPAPYGAPPAPACTVILSPCSAPMGASAAAPAVCRAHRRRRRRPLASCRDCPSCVAVAPTPPQPPHWPPAPPSHAHSAAREGGWREARGKASWEDPRGPERTRRRFCVSS